jgi:hypothetical protein
LDLLLNFDRAGDGVYGAPELNQRAIAVELEGPA